MVYGLMILKLWLKIKWDFDFRFVGPLRGLSNNPFLETRRNSFFGFLVSYEIRNFSWTRNLGCEFEEAMTVKQPKNRVMKKNHLTRPVIFQGEMLPQKTPNLNPWKTCRWGCGCFAEESLLRTCGCVSLQAQKIPVWSVLFTVNLSEPRD